MEHSVFSFRVHFFVIIKKIFVQSISGALVFTYIRSPPYTKTLTLIWEVDVSWQVINHIGQPKISSPLCPVHKKPIYAISDEYIPIIYNMKQSSRFLYCHHWCFISRAFDMLTVTNINQLVMILMRTHFLHQFADKTTSATQIIRIIDSNKDNAPWTWLL